MNITLSADEKLIARARAYARAHNMSLNQVIRDFMTQLTGERNGAEAADEFAQLAREQPGRSPDGFRFDRDAAHTRGDDG